VGPVSNHALRPIHQHLLLFVRSASTKAADDKQTIQTRRRDQTRLGVIAGATMLSPLEAAAANFFACPLKMKEIIMPQIATDVLAVLDAAITDGPNVVLPVQLERGLYLATNKVLRAAGGMWNRSAKAHVFEGDAADILEPIILTGHYSRAKQDFGQFDTPAGLARDVIERAGVILHMRVLEPSAGLGNLAVEAIAAGGHVHTIEIDPTRCAKLTMRIAKLESCHAAAYSTGQHADFLAINPDRSYDRIVMNPPFSRQDDIRHVMHAFGFLKPGRRLVAIMSAGVLFRSNRLTTGFRDFVTSHAGTIQPLPEGSFSSSGANVNTCIVTLDAPSDGGDDDQSA